MSAVRVALEKRLPVRSKHYHDPCSHVANAHRIREHFGDKLLFVEGIGWHVWGPPWVHDEHGAERMVQGLGRIIADEAAQRARAVGAGDDEAKRLFVWAGQSEQLHCIRASLATAASLMNVRAEVLDADPWMLACPGGVLELQSGSFRAHRQADHITKVAGADFDPDAKAPLWEAFVHRAMAGDAELIDYLQRLAGYCLAGHRGEHLLPIFYGGGGNGKSVFLGALQAAFGQYAGTAAPGLLIAQHGNEHPTAMADLQGRRLVIASETGEGGRLAEDQVKQLTGGDKISARRMRQDFYEFSPTHQIVLQTNHRPRVNGVDEGIWRRLRLVPFTVTIPAEERDPYLPAKLRAELPGILAWAYRGLRKYLAEGFREPAAVKAATAEYRDASDVIGQFFADCCELHPSAVTASSLLFAAYSAWCRENNERPATAKAFGQRLQDRGLVSCRGTTGARAWQGIGLHA
jgi:putative DNA primase/helicase